MNPWDLLLAAVSDIARRRRRVVQKLDELVEGDREILRLQRETQKEIEKAIRDAFKI